MYEIIYAVNNNKKKHPAMDEVSSIIELSRVLNLLFYDSFTNNYLSRITPKSLTKNQFFILKILAISGPLLVSEIADLLKLSHAAASKNIDVLVNYNLVDRKTLPTDRRKASVSILKSGEKIVRGFQVSFSKKQSSTKELLSQQEKETLSLLLNKYVQKCLLQEKELDFICENCSGHNNDNCVLLSHNVKCRYQID